MKPIDPVTKQHSNEITEEYPKYKTIVVNPPNLNLVNKMEWINTYKAQPTPPTVNPLHCHFQFSRHNE